MQIQCYLPVVLDSLSLHGVGSQYRTQKPNNSCRFL